MLKRFKAWAMAASNTALCAVRKWWRPLCQVGIGGSLVVNGMILPVITRTYPDLAGLALLVGAAAPFAAIRAWEKKQGTAE